MNYGEFEGVDDHTKLVSMCPLNVFDIEDDTAVVKNVNNCSMCRECIRHKGWDKKVNLYKKSDHFVFSIESVGSISSTQIFKRSINILKNKAKGLLQTDIK